MSLFAVFAAAIRDVLYVTGKILGKKQSGETTRAVRCASTKNV
jgi:hypothetical protein